MPDETFTAPPTTEPAHATPGPAGSRYILGEEIAHGGMGVVYRASDAVFGREVAVKVLRDRYASDSGTARRFHDEARITGQLQHPGIPPAHDLGVLPDGRPFLAMKLIKGDTLDALLAARPALAADRGRFLAVFEQVCQAVAYAHAHGVVHRDLKPHNVMVGAFGEVQVMDWGLAKVLTARTEEAADPLATRGGTEILSLRDSDGSFTQAGSVMGTPAFMPPEQAVGAVTKIDARSDVFGLGGILCVILTGAPPFAANTAETTRVKAATGDLTDCLTRLDGCGADPELVALCKVCLNPKQDDRPADAGEVARAVAALRAAADERARQAELDRVKAEGAKAAAELQAAEQRKRRRVQAALGLAFTALVVLGGAFAWWADSQRRSRREAAERDVSQAIEAAVARYSLAQGADTDLALWAEARAAALQARERAAGSSAEVRERIDGLLAEIERVGKNRRLVAALLDIQASMGDTVANDSSQDFGGAAARYEQAFRDYGADLGGLTPDEAADLLRSLGAGSTVQLAAALDDWAYVRYQHKWQSLSYSDRGRAYGLAAAAGQFHVTRLLDPDPLRNQIREAVLARDTLALARLAEECDPATQPVQTVNLVSVWQYQLGKGFDAAKLVRFLRRAQSHHPGDFQINHNLAWFLNLNRQHADAASHSLAAIAVRPTSAAAWLDYTNAMTGLGREEEALAGYRRVAVLSPRTWVYRVRAGAVLERLGRTEEAAAEYRKALTNALEYPDFNSQLVVLADAVGGWKRHGLFDEFKTGILLAGRLGPQTETAYHWLGRALHNVGELDAAVVVLREAVRHHPNDALTRRLLGSWLREQGDLDGAAEQLEAAVRLNPKDTIAAYTLRAVRQEQADRTAPPPREVKR